MFKFIHAADIHLDSPLRGLEQYEGAPVQEIRDAARRALENLVELAIEQRVAFVVIAGDLYDGDWRDYNTGLFFVEQARRLNTAGIPLYIVSGNHDAANRMTRSLRLPDNVTAFSSRAPESVPVPGLDVLIHGQSFASAAVFEDLSADFPDAQPGVYNIGLLHTCATGREGHDRYAPCSIEGLRSKGYHYWALGHIHQREILQRDPLIVFPGNIQGRHIRESGAKGCYVVTVNDDHATELEFHELDVLRWELVEVNVDQAQAIDQVLDLTGAQLEAVIAAAAGGLLAVRIRLHGETQVHRNLHRQLERWTNEIRSLALEIGKGDVWVEKVKLQTSETSRLNGESDSVVDDALGQLALVFQEAKASSDTLAALNLDFSDIIKKLPAELRQMVRPEDAGWLAEVVAEAEPLLLSRLTGAEEEQ